MARIAHDQKLLLVATSRPGLPAEELANFERLDVVRRLSLERISPDDIKALLLEAFRSEALAEDLAGQVVSRSDGNPLFVMEIIRELKESGLLDQEPDGSYIASGEVVSIQIPSSVRELLLARLGEIGPEDRTLLEVGSVEGFHFDPDLTARALEIRRLEVLQRLAQIERRFGLVRATGAGFQFDHHQFQELIYTNLPPLLRSEYHALLASGYEVRSGVRGGSPEQTPGDAAVFLAEHFLKGGRRAEGARLVLSSPWLKSDS